MPGVRGLAEGELHPHPGRFRRADALRDTGQSLLFPDPQHVTKKLGRNAHEDVQVGPTCARKGFEGLFDIRGKRPGEGGNIRTFHLVTDLANAVCLFLGRRRESGLNDVDPQSGQLTGKGQTVFRGQHDKRQLVPVAERRIKDFNISFHDV